MIEQKHLEAVIKSIREKHSDFVIVTATQPPRPESSIPPRRLGRGDELDIVIIDYISLIK